MIPAYNEEQSIGEVIKQIPRSIPGIDDVKVLVIDDGSTDGTVEEAKKAGADKIVFHKHNRGLGITFKTGLEHAVEMGGDIIVNIDADNQYNPKEIQKLIKPILESKADMVLGDREIKKLDHMPFSKKIGNRIATWVTGRVSCLPIKDAQTGFRAFTKDAALKMNLLGNYTYVQESIIQAAKKGLKVEQIPVEFRKREGKSRLISGLFSYAKRAGGIIIRSYRDYHPLKSFTYISLIFFFLSFYFGLKVLFHYLSTGVFTGVVGTALLSGILFVTSVLIFTVGLLADMLKRNREIQEEILYRLKKDRL